MIAAEGEQKASRALREAAEVIAESPSALQVKLRKRKCHSCKVRAQHMCLFVHLIHLFVGLLFVNIV